MSNQNYFQGDPRWDLIGEAEKQIFRMDQNKSAQQLQLDRIESLLTKVLQKLEELP